MNWPEKLALAVRSGGVYLNEQELQSLLEFIKKLQAARPS